MISDADRGRIAEAIRAAEAKTSGEIFCVVAGRASSYALAPIAWAAVLALLVPWPLINLTNLTLTATAVYLLQLAVFAGLVALLWRPAIRYRLVSRRTRNERAHALAMEQFRRQHLQKTEGRTGVLIFAALAERYAEIAPDAGIAQKVPADAWDRIVADLVSAIRQGREGEGLVAAIGQCGVLLAQHLPAAPGAVNPDELPDRLVEI
jgi:putative membrane protein